MKGRSRRRGAALAALLGTCLASSGACASNGGVAHAGLETVTTEGLLAKVEDREGPLVLNFWATWCAPCVAELPALEALADEVDEEGVRVQTVSLDLALPVDVDSVEELADYVAERDMTLPVWVFDGDAQELAEALELPGSIPYTMVYAAEGGEPRVRHLGQASLEQFREMVDRALAAP